MEKKILFSPVGNTDPIKYFSDGSMIHIARVYQPDVIYLYLSKEMLVHHENDNRYIRTLELLEERLNHKFEIHIIKNENMIDVQDYDTFYNEFNHIISEIESHMKKKDMLLVNMASGTPAMKSALVVMATLAEYRFIPVQVSTPKKKSNLEYDERVDYDIETNWELNEDNKDNFENRCKEVKCRNLVQMLKLDMIKKHIDAYDYHAAYEIAKELKDRLPAKTVSMLEIATERIKLNQNKVEIIASKYKFDIMPVKEKRKQKIFEYALALQIKVEREEFADFIRGITPISDDLLEIILEKKCGIALQNYCVRKKSAWSWDCDKLKDTEVGECLEKEFAKFRYDMVSSRHLKPLIDKWCENEETKEKVAKLIKVEQKVRNIAAHEIVSVTVEWIKEHTGMEPVEIMDIIRYLSLEAEISEKEENWNSYKKMNEKICKMLMNVK